MMKKFIVLCIISFFSIYMDAQKPISLVFDSVSYYAPYFLSESQVWVTHMEDGREKILELEKKGIDWEFVRIVNANNAIGGWADSVLYYYNASMDLHPTVASWPSFRSQNDELYVTGNQDMIIVAADYNGIGIHLYEVRKDGNKWRRPKPIGRFLDMYEYYSPFLTGDTLYFSRKEEEGKFQIYYSLYDNVSMTWSQEEKLLLPYNLSDANNIFYSRQLGREYFGSDRSGKVLMYETHSEHVFHKSPYATVFPDTVELSDKYNINLRDGDRFSVGISPNGYSYFHTTVPLKNMTREEAISFLNQVKDSMEQYMKTPMDTANHGRIYTQLGVYSRKSPRPNFGKIIPKYNAQVVRENWQNGRKYVKYILESRYVEEAFQKTDYCMDRYDLMRVDDIPFVYVGILSGGFRIYKKLNGRYELIYHHNGKGDAQKF